MLTFGNQGQAIVNTNYWDSDLARDGYVFLSWNAGAGRLLVPDGREGFLREMKSARYVIVSRGAWPDAGLREGIELLFEDDSASPFCVHMGPGQTDRLIPETEQGGRLSITVWTRYGQQLRFPGKYRKVSTIPCLEPWKLAS